MQHKQVRFSLKGTDDQQGFVAAYLSVFGNVDQGNDRVIKGAFAQSIKDAQARVDQGKATFLCSMLWNHDVDEPIGGWFSLKEDTYGLLGAGQINLETQRGAEAYSLIKQGAISQFSIGYDVLPGGYSYTKDGVRELSKLRLWECSPVTFAMNDEALLVSVKGKNMNHRRSFNSYLAEARKASFPDSTWTAIQLTMTDLQEELGQEAPDMAKVRKLTNKLQSWWNSVPQTTAQDLGQVLGGMVPTYAGYDAQGNPKSRLPSSTVVRQPTQGEIDDAYERMKAFRALETGTSGDLSWKQVQTNFQKARR